MLPPPQVCLMCFRHPDYVTRCDCAAVRLCTGREGEIGFVLPDSHALGVQRGLLPVRRRQPLRVGVVRQEAQALEHSRPARGQCAAYSLSMHPTPRQALHTHDTLAPCRCSGRPPTTSSPAWPARPTVSGAVRGAWRVARGGRREAGGGRHDGKFTVPCCLTRANTHMLTHAHTQAHTHAHT
jgi:hypothetical protein